MKDPLLRAPKSAIPDRRKKKQLPLLGPTPQRNPKELGVPFSPSSPFSGITDDLSSTSPCLLDSAAGDFEEVSSNHSELPDFTPLPSVDLLSDDSEITKESIWSNSPDQSDRLLKSPAVILSEIAGEAGGSTERSPAVNLCEIAGESGGSAEKSPAPLLREIVGDATNFAEISSVPLLTELVGEAGGFTISAGLSEAADQEAAQIVLAEKEMAMLGFSEAVTKLADAIMEQQQERRGDMSRAAEAMLASLTVVVLVVLLITMVAPGGLEIWNGSSEIYGPAPT